MVAITRYRDNPGFFGLQRLNRILDEAFAGLPFQEQGNVITSTWFAPTDVSENENSLQISMELPGVDPDDVRLSLENNVLTIRGEKRQQSEENDNRIHRFERTFGLFERTFVLPNTVDPDKIDARYENGVLFVSIPKAERARPREIRVNTAAGGSSQLKTGSRPQGAVGEGAETGERSGQGASNQGSQRSASSRAGTEGATVKSR
jgi:HSP20 family protein